MIRYSAITPESIRNLPKTWWKIAWLITTNTLRKLSKLKCADGGKADFHRHRAFVGTSLPRDRYYQQSRQAWPLLSDSAIRLYSSDAVSQETMVFLHHRAGTKSAIDWAEAHLQGKVISWLPVDAQVRRSALPWMKKFADQAVSFVDATSFALMRRENIRHVFSFDHHFAAAGFKLWPV